MSEYERTTRECSPSQLHPELLKAVQKYFHEHDLGDLQTGILRCCETISKRKSASKLVAWLSNEQDMTIHTGMVLTSERLIWVHHGDRSVTRLNAAHLDRIGVRFRRSLFSRDVGLEIVGYIGDDNARVHGRIGMGTEPAAQQFCEEVKQAVSRINPPTSKNIFNWPMQK